MSVIVILGRKCTLVVDKHYTTTYGPLLAESTHVAMPTKRWLVSNTVIDTYVQRTPRGRYTCQINQLISRQDSKGASRGVRCTYVSITALPTNHRSVGMATCVLSANKGPYVVVSDLSNYSHYTTYSSNHPLLLPAPLYRHWLFLTDLTSSRLVTHPPKSLGSLLIAYN